MTEPTILRHVTVTDLLRCSVCLEETNNGWTHESKVTHIFHESCIHTLSHCPNCRAAISMPPTTKTVPDSRTVTVVNTCFDDHRVISDTTCVVHPPISRLMRTFDLKLRNYTFIKYFSNGSIERVWLRFNSQAKVLTDGSGHHIGFEAVSANGYVKMGFYATV